MPGATLTAAETWKTNEKLERHYASRFKSHGFDLGRSTTTAANRDEGRQIVAQCVFGARGAKVQGNVKTERVKRKRRQVPHLNINNQSPKTVSFTYVEFSTLC